MVDSKIQTKVYNQNIQEKPILVFSTLKGISVIQSPSKSAILSLLKEKEHTFDEIVQSSGKSKSTVSVHLSDLTQQGIIDSKIDSRDKRKKIFYLNSLYVGKFIPQIWDEKEESSIEFLMENLLNQGNPHEFFHLMFHILRVELIQQGINIDPILYHAGIKIGQTIYNQIEDDQTNDFIKKLSHFWKINGLGNIVVENRKPIILRAYDCFECENLPQIGEAACPLGTGIIESVFSIHFAKKVKVSETRCYAQGDEYCCFVIS